MNTNYLYSVLMVGLPVWILVAGGLVTLTLDAMVTKRGGRVVYAAGALTVLASLVVAFQQWIGNQDYVQDLLLTDRMTQFFVFVVLLVGLISLFNLYSYLAVGGIDDDKSDGPVARSSVSLLLFSLSGMIFLFGSDHLIVNFIGLEIMSLAIYVMVGANRYDLRSNEAAIKYFVIGSVASAILLYGIALTYGSFGSMQLSELGKVSGSIDQVFLPRMAIVMLLVGLLFKLSLAPFHFWAPDVYEGAPSPVTGFMATGVKVAAFALFIRVLTTLKVFPVELVTNILTVTVILTVIIGNLGAIVQDNIKRMLAYSSIAHAGYILLGLVIGLNAEGFDPQVSSAVLFYLLTYSIMTLGAFGVLCVMVNGHKEVTQFSDLNGLGYSRPYLAAAFSLFMISLLGIPPTAGFAGKYAIFSYAVQTGHIKLAILGVLTSAISAYYYLRPLVSMYFRGPATSSVVREVPLPLVISIIFCAIAVLYLGLDPTAYLKMAQIAVGALKL